jgi:hypothetical protein
MRSPAMNLVAAFVLIGCGLAIAAAGIYVGETDDAPGAALIGIVAAVGFAVLGIRRIRLKAS